MQLPIWDLVALGNIAITGIVVFVLQRLFEARMNRSLEKFKSDLQESHTRFATTYPKLLELIDSLQTKGVELVAALEQMNLLLMISGGEGIRRLIGFSEEVEKLKTAIRDYSNFIHYNELRLPMELVTLLLTQQESLDDLWIKLYNLESLATPESVARDSEYHQKQIDSVLKYITSFKAQHDVIRRECRKLYEATTKLT